MIQDTLPTDSVLVCARDTLSACAVNPKDDSFMLFLFVMFILIALVGLIGSANSRPEW